MKYSNRLSKIFHHSVVSEKIILDYLVDNMEDQEVYDLKKHQEEIGMLVRDIMDDLREEAEEEEL